MSEFYNKSSELENRNRQIGLWMKGWCKEMFDRDWDYCVSLTYFKPIISEVIGNRNLKGYVKKLREWDKEVEGFVVTELDNNLLSLHHHLILKSDILEFRMRRLTNSFWSNYGINDVKVYDSSYELSFAEYMTKHLNKTKRNSWEIISNFSQKLLIRIE